RHTRCYRDWSSDVCSSDLPLRRRAAPVSTTSPARPGSRSTSWAGPAAIVCRSWWARKASSISESSPPALPGAPPWGGSSEAERSRPGFLPEQSPGAPEDRAPHRPGETAGVRVLAARVVGADQGRPSREQRLGTVREGRSLARGKRLPETGGPEPPFPGDAPQGGDDLDAPEQRDLGLQVAPAGVELPARGSIGRGRAAGGRRHVAVGQNEPVIPPRAVGVIRESVAVEGLVEPVPARVSGEDPPGPVAPVGGGSQADD